MVRVGLVWAVLAINLCARFTLAYLLVLVDPGEGRHADGPAWRPGEV